MSESILTRVALVSLTVILVFVTAYYDIERNNYKARLNQIREQLLKSELISKAKTAEEKEVLIWGSNIALSNNFMTQGFVWDTGEMIWVKK